jgi:small subunit ribosomal protein S1
MSEGTKIGEYKDNQDFSAAVKRESDTESSAELSATKIGEMSEFEKSLVQDQQSKQPQQQPKEEPSGGNELSFADEMDRLLMDYQEGDIIKGTVRSIEKSGVLVDIRYKSDGFISNSEFSNDPDVQPGDILNIGDEVSVFIEKLESKEGYTVLSRKKVEYEEAWSGLIDFTRSKEAVDVKITSKVQGGLVAEYYGIKGFVPASQVVKGAEEALDEFVGSTLNVIVLKADRRRRKVIFSHKLAGQKNTGNRDEILSELEVGQVRDGRVSSIKDFGVFVDLGGVEGLVHISELSWSHVSHPGDIVKLGDEVRVFVLGVDKETGRISLGMKQLEPDPWVKVSENYAVGQVIKGKISRTMPFGAFITVEGSLEGLIHISELSYDHVDNVEDVVRPGDEVEARIIKLIPEEQKIGLSLKGLDDANDPVSVSVANDAPAEPEQPVVEAATEVSQPEENSQDAESSDQENPL